MKSVLFISDSGLNNPILHSQGLPMMEKLSEKDFRFFFAYFNKPVNSIPEISANRNKVHSSSIEFIEINIKSISLLPGWMEFFIFGFHSVRKIINNHDIRILHARSFFPVILSYLLKLLMINDLKIIYDNRGVYIDEMVEIGKWKNGIKEKLLRLIEKFVERRSDKIVIVSNCFKNHLVRKHGQKITSKLEVIANRTDIDNNIIANKKLVEPITLVYSGSAAKWQNINDLIHLFNLADQIFTSIKFKVVSYELDKIIEIIPSHNELKSKISFISADSKEVKNELSVCNCGILLRQNNLINNVSSPLKFAEYMSAGLPVLVSEGIGDTAEFVNKFNVGVIVKNKNYVVALKELKDLLSDSNVYQRCLDVASMELNLDISIRQYEKIYNGLFRK